MTLRKGLPVVVAALLIVAVVAPEGRAEAKPLKSTGEWRGSIEDLTLQSAAPASGVIASKKELTKLWKAWKPDEKMPQIDFTKELVLTSVTRGSRLTLSASLDDKGDLQPRAVSTKDLRPGFRFHIITVRRAEIKSVNGKPLPKD